MTDQKPACIHPDGYDGECPCPPSCGCCKVAPAAEPLRARIAAAIEDAIYEHRELMCQWGETDGTTQEIARRATNGAMGVRDREMEQLRAGRATWKAKAEEIERDRDRLAGQVDQLIARLGEYADRAIRNGERADQLAATITRVHAAADQIRRSALNANGEPLTAYDRGVNTAVRRILAALEAPDGGPTVAEAAADDEAHWTTKYAGETP